METILFLAHTEADGSLARGALETFTTAHNLAATLAGSSMFVGLVGEQVQPAANQLAGAGAKKILAVAGADFAQPRYASDSAAAEALARAAQTSVIIAPSTSRWNRVLPGVSHRLQGRADTHVTGVAAANGVLTVARWYYRQRLEATLNRTQRPWFLLVESGAAKAWEGQPGSATIENVAVNLPDTAKRTKVTGIQSPPEAQQTIRPDAALLFVTGAGWTKKQADGQPHLKAAETLILGFLKHTRASLGSTKSLVDLSGEGQAVLPFLTHLNQVGQTGSTPRHPKGLASCCHGEEPHTVGWRFINERRAINLDPNCGWARGKADVLYVADAFAVIAKVNELLEKRSSG
jgi:electron transfer flavoprotein alpha subunit